jgi:hypothetical protein
MNRIVHATVATLLALSPVLACAGGRPASAAGKPRAPVTIEADLSGGAAKVTVRFDRAAKDVRVHVRGLEGLAVTSEATPVQAESVEKGELASFDVTFTPGPGQSFLSVAVSGNFGGGRRATSVSFAVGEKSAEQRKPTGTVIEGPEGERVKVLPSGK